MNILNVSQLLYRIKGNVKLLAAIALLSAAALPVISNLPIYNMMIPILISSGAYCIIYFGYYVNKIDTRNNISTSSI